MAQGDPNGPPESIAFGQFTGLKNTLTDLRLKPTDLARAVNVDLDDAGQAISRRGYTRVATGGWHSLFGASNGMVLGVKDGALGVIHPDYSHAAICNVAFPDDSELASMAYVQVQDDVYFSCEADSGIVNLQSLTARPWGDGQDLWLSPVVNPTAGLSAIRGSLLGKPPLATALALWNGRIWLAQGTLLWATEMFAFNFVDKTKNFFQFEAPITGIGAVNDGMYVGTDDGVWFLSGPLGAMKREQVMQAAMIRGSLVYTPSELANPARVDPAGNAPVEMSVMFLTTRGICAGGNTGQCYNLTENAFAPPESAQAAALYRFQDGVNQYVVVTDTGGSPASVARSGDHVDPELKQDTVQRQDTQVLAIGDTIEAEVIRAS